MIQDIETIDLGGVKLTIRRLTLKEIRENRKLWVTGANDLDDTYCRVIADHVKTADGKPLNPDDLSFKQMQTLVKELVGIPDGSGIADFIGVLC